MIIYKSLFALAIAAGLMAACQQSKGPAMQTSVESDVLAKAMTDSAKVEREYTPTEPFKNKVNELKLQLVERLLTKCIHARSKESMEACFHERMLVGFDTDGTVGSNCPQHEDLDADLKCIVVGSMAYQLAMKVGNDAASFDWSEPEKSAQDLSAQFFLQHLRDCLSNGAASDPKDCVVTRMTTALELTNGDLDPCDAFVDDDFTYGQCIAEAFSYKFIGAGIARM